MKPGSLENGERSAADVFLNKAFTADEDIRAERGSETCSGVGKCGLNKRFYNS